MRGSPDPGAGEPDEVAKGPPRVARLRKRADFVAASKGTRSHGRAMTIQVRRRPEDGSDLTRFGFTVTRKVGHAVERNRIKRRLREAVRAQDLAPQPGHDYVIVARRDALTTPFRALVAEIARLIDPSRRKPSGRGGRANAASRPVPAPP